MSKPILYYVPLSPPARATLLTAREIGLDIEIKPLRCPELAEMFQIVTPRTLNMTTKEHKSKSYTKINPLGKVPALVDGDFCVWDSHAICIYLVEKYAKDDKLYPRDLIKRTRINEILFFEGTFLFQKMYEVIEPMYFGKIRDIPQDKVNDINLAYEIIEGFLKDGKKFLCGDDLTIADLSVWSTLLSIRFLVPIDDHKYPKLETWLRRMKTRDTYEINQNGANQHYGFIKSCLDGKPIIPVPSEYQR